jgi:hypothetical protein
MSGEKERRNVDGEEIRKRSQSCSVGFERTEECRRTFLQVKHENQKFATVKSTEPSQHHNTTTPQHEEESALKPHLVDQVASNKTWGGRHEEGAQASAAAASSLQFKQAKGEALV